MILAFICNILMIAFVLDSSSPSLDDRMHESTLTFSSVEIWPWEEPLECPHYGPIPVLQRCKYFQCQNQATIKLTRYCPQRNLLAAIFFCAATGLAKGSILLFYLRIFPSKKVVYTVWSVFAFTIAYSLACVFVNIFSCNPVKASWDLTAAATAVCINR